eukprot:6694076-Heterocapsa_arctica.AAC.1
MHRASNMAGQILALQVCGKSAGVVSAREGEALLPQGTRRIFPGGTAGVWTSYKQQTTQNM